MYCSFCDQEVKPVRSRLTLDCPVCGWSKSKFVGNQKVERTRYNRNTAAGYIYIIKAGDYHKIGLSKNPEQRLLSLQTATPFECILIHKIPVENMIEAEQDLHEKLKDYHVRGEWFALDRETLHWLLTL